MSEPVRTPWQQDRDRVELTGHWPEASRPYHRHFANDAVHRDGGPECDQSGTPRRVYVFDPEYLHKHEMLVARYAAAHPDEFTENAEAMLLEGALRVLEGTSRKPFNYTAGHWLGVKDTLREVAAAIRAETEGHEH